MATLTHINDKGDLKPCRAHVKPCKFAPVINEAYFETASQLNKIVSPATEETVDNKFGGHIGQAVKASFDKNVEVPKWWKKYVNKVQVTTYKNPRGEEQPCNPSNPVILDTVSLPGKLDGGLIVWEDNSHDVTDLRAPYEDGMQIQKCSLIDKTTGEELGYIKLVQITEESFTSAFGKDENTVFRYLDRYSGTSFDFTGFEHKTKLEQKQQLYKDYFKGKGYYPLPDGKVQPAWSFDAKNVPSDEAFLDEKLNEVRANESTNMLRFVASYSQPFTEYSNIKAKNLRGKGYGAALYIYATKKVGTSGKVLRSSGLLSGEATKLWNNFKKHMPNRVGAMSIQHARGEVESDHFVLDFRTFS